MTLTPSTNPDHPKLPPLAELRELEMKLKQNILNFKENLSELGVVYMQEFSEELANRGARLNAWISSANGWMQSKVQSMQSQKVEDKDLEIQMGSMENEGGCPDGGPCIPHDHSKSSTSGQLSPNPTPIPTLVTGCVETPEAPSGLTRPESTERPKTDAQTQAAG